MASSPSGGRPAAPWLTRPIDGSPYPLTMIPQGQDPNQSSARLTGAAMVAMVVAAYLVVSQLINTGVVGLGYGLNRGGTDWAGYWQTAQNFGNIWGVLGAQLGLAAVTLAVWAFFRLVHHRPLAWLWSISPGVRWRYGLLCLIVGVVVVGASTVYYWVTGPGWSPPQGWGWYAVVILLTTPFQALGEEVLFRGYMMQAFGAIVRNVWFPIVATAVIFALFHGVQNPWLFSSRLVFGLLAGILVWRTGGLEAGVAIHVVNNLFAFGLGIATGTLSQLRTTTSVSWGSATMDVVMFALCAAACWGIAVWLRVPARVRPDAVR